MLSHGGGWKLSRAMWKANAPADFIEQQIAAQLDVEYRTEGSRRVWTVTFVPRLVWATVALDFETGRISITAYAHVGVRYLCWALLILFPAIFLARSAEAIPFLSALFPYFAVGATVLLLTTLADPETYSLTAVPGTLIDQEMTPTAFLIVFPALILLWHRLRSQVPAVLIDTGLLLFAGILIFQMYSTRPERPSSIGPAVQQLQIPGLATLFLLYPIIIFFLTIYLSSLPSIETSTEVDLLLYTSQFVLIPLSVFVLITATFVRSARTYLQSLAHSRLEPITSPLHRYAVLVAYLIASLITGIAALFAVTITWYTITSSTLLVDRLFAVINLPLEPITEGYTATGAYFSGWPLFPTSVYTAVFYTILLSPIYLFMLGWLYSITTELATKYRLLTTAGQWNGDSAIVPEDITVLIPNQDGGLGTRPMSLFFGRRNYIIVDQKVIETLSEDELNAIFAHEVYHFKNRDLVFNAIASLFAVFLGGRNALLTFYDYPAVEREADQYAATQVGRQPLINAISKLKSRQIMEHGISVGGPDFVPESSKQVAEEDSLVVRIRNTVNDVQALYAAPYHLFFGRVLLDAAHLDKNERIDIIG
jgi:Zn-dependent protease with chaperone function